MAYVAWRVCASCPRGMVSIVLGPKLVDCPICSVCPGCLPLRRFPSDCTPRSGAEDGGGKARRSGGWKAT
eukprot:5905624-Pyramimonas_sp.AAC.1